MEALKLLCSLLPFPGLSVVSQSSLLDFRLLSWISVNPKKDSQIFERIKLFSPLQNTRTTQTPVVVALQPVVLYLCPLKAPVAVVFCLTIDAGGGREMPGQSGVFQR